MFQFEQQYFIIQQITSCTMKEANERAGKSKKQQNEGLTQKKLQFLLPSSKQILLINSSIKYNTLKNYNEDSAQKMKMQADTPAQEIPSIDKQNSPIASNATKTSILRIEEAIPERLEESAAQMKQKSLKILAQTYNHLNVPTVPSVAPKGKPFSSIHFQEGQEKLLTSLNNIVIQEPEPEIKQESSSKKELLARIAQLQNLVYDIISGKVPISRPQSERRIRQTPSKRESILEMGEKYQRREKRSATWSKDPNEKASKSMKFDKSKLKIDNTIVEKKEEHNKEQRGFIIKKKNQLKLTDNYKPIREATENYRPMRESDASVEKIDKRSLIKNSSSIEGEPERPTKLRLRVNFVPNIINL